MLTPSASPLRGEGLHTHTAQTAQRGPRSRLVCMRVGSLCVCSLPFGQPTRTRWLLTPTKMLTPSASPLRGEDLHTHTAQTAQRGTRSRLDCVRVGPWPCVCSYPLGSPHERHGSAHQQRCTMGDKQSKPRRAPVAKPTSRSAKERHVFGTYTPRQQVRSTGGPAVNIS